MKRVAVFCFNLMFSVSLFAQYSGVAHYGVKDGLPSSNVYDVTQDSKGFVWIGTDAGLVRYDGTYFKTYTTKDGLPDNEVLGLHFDPKTNRMWILTYCKQACYYRFGRFYTADNDSSLRALKCTWGEYLNGNYQKGVGEFLFNGSTIYPCIDDTVTTIDLKTAFKIAPILQVKKWNDHVFDILTDSGLIEFQKGEIRNIYPYHIDEFEHGERCKWLDGVMVRYGSMKVERSALISLISNMEFYVRKYTGEYKLKGKIELKDSQSVSNVLLSADKFIISIWGKGVFDLDTNLHSPMKQIWNGSVNTIYEDNNNNLWVATTNDGVYLLKRQKVLNYSAENGLVHDNITALAYDAGRLYMGSSVGDIYILKNEKLIPFDTKYNIPLERIRSIVPVKDNLMVISNSIILNYDFREQKSFCIPQLSGGPKSILKLADDKTILVGLIGTMISYNINTKASQETQFLKRIIAMAQHPDGTVFCGSLDGLYTYKYPKLIHVVSKDRDLQTRITSLCFTPDTLLWIGTPSDGVIAFDGKKIIGHISSSEYLSYTGAMCRKVIAGHANDIWVATNSGIDRIQYHWRDSLVIDNITPLNTVDGLLSDDVNDILLHDSLMCAATAHGLSILNVNELSSPKPIPVYIMALRINDQDSAIHEGTYELTYHQNNLQIQYVGVSIMSGGYLRYQYRLLGSSDKWETTTNTSVELRSLSPGNYTFEVAVLDKFGNRSRQTARVSFVISTAFYQTVWFWTIVFVFGLVIGYYLIRRSFENRQQQYELEQDLNNKIIELEQKALKAQMNPHFIFNCLTAIQHFVNKEDVYSANMYLSNFAKLIRKTLDLSGEQYITLDKEVAYLEDYIGLEKMRFQDKFRFSIVIGDGVDVDSVIIPPMLLQPIIENAIRHGLRNKDSNDGLLIVTFTREGQNVVCRIDDNGIGLKKSAELKTKAHVEYHSKGMKLTESRIGAINMLNPKKIYMEVQNKYNDGGQANGTLVILKFEQ